MSELSRVEKLSALDRVLASATLARSSQLREFLRFVGRGIIEGREDEIKEYVIGVEALGRGAQFDPSADPIVRVQAARLRQKLEEYYRREGCEDQVLITLPKGRYIPCFLKKTAICAPLEDEARADADSISRLLELTDQIATYPTPPSGRPESSFATQPAPLQPATLRGKSHGMVILPVAAFLVCILLLALWLFQWSKDEGTAQAKKGVSAEPAIKDDLAQLFASFFESNTPTILSFHVPPLITYESKTPVIDLSNLAKSPAVAPASKSANWLANESLQQRKSLTGTGELIGTFLLTQVFMQHGQKLEVKPSTLLRWEDFRHANVIILGGPRQNEIFREIQSKLNFNYPYERPGRVINAQPRSGEPANYDATLDGEGNGVDYAVVSKLVDPVSGYQILLFGGNSGISVEAGVRYFTNPLNAEQLLNQLKGNATNLPGAYQLVLKVASKNAIPQSIEYVTHRASDARRAD